ncbi:transglycosylase SLT domain-containing protein [Polynucleobacter sp. MG-5-Ahmo-C2]|jgi:soluble lytic murein transglycosylase-like protein|uniref:transglycosylase SLT domain-containing protein n=1 Tax=unclassified Polynucleobacter TaxID=2640945 RepID=UPI001BFD5F93|nr:MULTISPECIES: transglycosylase SLT domain-containing protein [unclassified Polynucleobacter]QWD72771.1 transglycosylase SLT domain-containing protein [Polynucleobacter sp. UB-Raua-W9]QWD98870.1 transglycosylase SLT domain-containing protein [Polynucleobacter sp. MG-5-Ahmo-C2]
MNKWITYNLDDTQDRQPAILAAKDLLSQAMAPVYRVINGVLVMAVFVVVSLWLSGNGTNAGAFDLARILVPDEARNMVWSNGFGMLEQYKASNDSAAQTADSEIAAVIYNKSNPISTGLGGPKQQTVALLMPSVAQVQVKSISHLADRIPTSKIDPQALDSNLMGSIQNQRAVADFFEKKYKLDRAKIEEYVSNTILVAKEVKIDPVLLLAVISVESNFNPTTRSEAGAEGLMQVMTSVHKDKYALYGGTTQAVKPEVNIRVGAYILKYLIATAGSLRNGLKFYVGAANAEDDGGYTDKVMAERNRLISLCQTRSTNRLTLNGKDLRS